MAQLRSEVGMMSRIEQYYREDLDIPINGVTLAATLIAPPRPQGVIVFAHGSGSSRHSPRNQFVAGELQRANFATLLFDLLTPEEERIEAMTGHLRFNIELLTVRLGNATDWIRDVPRVRKLPIGYFGASTGAAAALRAAAERPKYIRAIVCRGGRPDLAGDALPQIQAPTLFIVGGSDTGVI